MNPVPKKKRIKNPELIAELKRKIQGCEYCGTQNSYFGYDLHHIQTRGAGGSDIPSNLIKLCRICHDLAGSRKIPASFLQHIAERRTL